MKKANNILRRASLVLALGFCFLAAVAFLNFSGVSAFTGPPPGGAGIGSGAIGVDSSNNLSIGTSTPLAGTKLLIVSPSVNPTGFALQILRPDGSPIFVVRNDGNIGVNTSTPTSIFTVQGNIYSTNNFTGTVAASNVISGLFASGNFAFQNSLGVATGSQFSLPQALSVYGGGYFSGSVGIGTTAPGARLNVVDSSNGISENTGGDFVVGRYAGGGNFNAQYSIPTGAPLFQLANAPVNNNCCQLVVGIDAANSFARIVAPSSNEGISFGTKNSGGGPVNNALVIAPSGNVGVGTTAPGQKLEVVGNVSSTGLCLGGVCNSTWSSALSGGQANYIPIWTSATAQGTSTIYQSSGNVGIGTTAPAYRLDVAGDANATRLCIAGVCQSTWPASGLNGGGTVNYVGKFTGTGTIGNSQIFDNGTNVGIGTTGPADKLQVSGNLRLGNGDGGVVKNLIFEGTGGNQDSIGSNGQGDITYMAGPNSNHQFNINDGGVIRQVLTIARVAGGGNVGIGTTAPEGSLHINGATGLSTTIYMSNTGFSQPDTALVPADVWGKFGVNSLYGGLAVEGVLANNGATIAYPLQLSGVSGKSVPAVQDAAVVIKGLKSNGGSSYANMSASTDAILFVTGDSANNLSNVRLAVFGNGNVGIGTTGPADKLQVSGNLRLGNGDGGVVKNLIFEGTGGNQDSIGSNGQGDITYMAGPNSNHQFNVNNGGVTQWVLTIVPTADGGSVGIGTTAPSQKLEINGGVRLNTTTAQPTCSSATRGTFWVVNGASGVKDNVQVCAKDRTDAYAWRAIY